MTPRTRLWTTIAIALLFAIVFTYSGATRLFSEACDPATSADCGAYPWRALVHLLGGAIALGVAAAAFGRVRKST